MAVLDGIKGRLKLTVKEKLLLELDQHSCDGDRGDYPVELTQKGLAESVGVRRSHVALSLQGIVDDKLVDVKKERIEGEKRRQNVYILTPNGRSRAHEIKGRVFSQEADFEMPGGVRHVTTESFLKVSSANLMSVINQLERGDLVRDEITIVTRPERRLITVFCPTCNKYLEVENSYIDETVGFDCPGCGRPYKIAPAERVIARRREGGGLSEAWPALVLVTVLIGGVAAYRIYLESFLCASVVAVAATLIMLAIYLAGSRFRDRDLHPRRNIAVKVSMIAVVLGFGLILLWDSLVARVYLLDELVWFVPLATGVALSFVAISRTRPKLGGEFVLSGGALLLMLAVLVVFVGELEGLSEGSAPLLGVLGVVLLVMSTTFPIENNLRTMDVMFSTGVLVLIIAFTEILPDTGSPMGALTFAVLVVLGLALPTFRFAQQGTGFPLGELFMSTLPLAVGALFFIAGLFMIGGGSSIAGTIEIGMMIPFIYFGLIRVFDKDWMYRLPIASFLVFAEIVCFAYAFMT
jgi:uncharacterized membrane protein YjfL (UPF0719 family)/DNA-binding MarR family transcriptional regulator